MPSGPLAHICLLVKDLDAAVTNWRTILEVVDPAQLENPVVVMNDFEAGGDVMRWATFVNHAGCEIQLLQPKTGPLYERLQKHGEGVHHIAFCREDLPEVVAELRERGIALTSDELSQDPILPWQAWTFISPRSANGVLVELAYAYKAVNGAWQPARAR